MSGSYQLYGGNPYSYGQGSGHLFFPMAASSPLDNPRTLSLPADSPFQNVSEGALATLLDPEGDSGGLPAPPAMPSPDQSLAGLGRSLATGLGVVTGPFGGIPAMMSQIAAAEMGMPPTGTMGVLGEAISRGLADLNSRDMTGMGLANAPEATGGLVGGFGLSQDYGDKDGPADGGTKDSTGYGDWGDPSPSADKGDPSAEGGDKGDSWARGGLIDLAGGGKIVTGLGGGLDDLIPTTINGRRAARLSDGEFVIPADVVSMMGDGSSRAGSQRLYDMMRAIRHEKTGNGQQAGPLQIGDTLRRIFK